MKFMNHKTTVFLSKCSKTHVQQCGGKKKFYACGGLSSPLAHQLSPPNTGIVDETLSVVKLSTEVVKFHLTPPPYALDC